LEKKSPSFRIWWTSPLIKQGRSPTNIGKRVFLSPGFASLNRSGIFIVGRGRESHLQKQPYTPTGVKLQTDHARVRASSVNRLVTRGIPVRCFLQFGLCSNCDFAEKKMATTMHLSWRREAAT
jgi:hypothetical protein